MPLSAEKIRDFASRFPTPLLLDDDSEIAKRLATIGQFDRVRTSTIRDESVASLTVLRESGLALNTDCLAAAERAKAAGFLTTPNRPEILFSADAFDQRTLGELIRLGVPIDCGSPEMISQLGDRCPGTEITISVNPDLGSSIGRGIWTDEVEASLLRADQDGVMVTGLRILAGDAATPDEIAKSAESVAYQIGRTLRTLILPVTPSSSGERTFDDPFAGIVQRLAQTFEHPIELHADVGSWLRRGTRLAIAEVRSVKKAGTRTIATLEIDSFALRNPAELTVIARTGDAYQRQSIEILVTGRKSNDYLVAATIPIPRVGDLMAWRVTDYDE
ncbi:hypothetical protein [Rubripirellula reticaptiva]|uniref:Diaminopimelate decarboxylase n=1 Tax=Rubripirellula reticaptiva TaxID=2528013 RepID=A0A5C6EJ27_9BACT|nr:hypothetical protein [Rubripirellula reticaptiva]TWU48087.1 Diaminopimelate decarboxylase [Rubripirellula reticaptiva]